MPKNKEDLEDILEDDIDDDQIDDKDDDNEEKEEETPSSQKGDESDEDDSKTGEEDDGSDDKAGAGKKPDDSEEDDGQLGQADDDTVDEDEEARREAKRQARQERKKRAREAREADKRLIASMSRQLEELGQRVAQVDKRGNQHELAQLDQAIQAHNNAIQRADAAIEEAFTKKDGKAFRAANQAKEELRDRLGRLNMVKEQMTRQNDTRGQPGAKINPSIISHAKKFAEEHTWYNVAAKDEDSRIVQAIDETLYEAGFDPATPEYWAELKDRVKRRLPHRFEKKQSSNKGGGNPPGKKKIVGKPGAMGGSAKKTVVQPGGGAVLSKARRDAMIADGLQPGTKEWTEQVKAYTKWDKANPPKSK